MVKCADTQHELREGDKHSQDVADEAEAALIERKRQRDEQTFLLLK